MLIASTDHNCIHERTDRRMEPFYWILTFEAMSFLLALAAALVAGPIYLVFRYHAWWTFLLLLLLLPGAWLARFTIRYLRSAIRKNRLLNRFRLYGDRIEYRIYNREDRTAREDIVPLERIERVYVSKYIAPYHYAYRKSKLTEQQPYFHILPILYVVYRDEWKNRVLTVPFYENYDTEIWLKELQKRGIPLWATNKLLSELPEEEQLRMLEEEANSLPFPFEHHLHKELELILEGMERRERAEAAKGNNNGQQELRPNETESAGNAVESSPRFVPQPSTWVIFILLYVFIFAGIKLADKGALPSDGTVLCLVVLFVAATVYQCLAKRLTFWVPLRFLLFTVAGWLLIGVVMAETDAGPGEEFMISAVSAIIFMAFFVWLPFGIVYWLRRKRRT